jgi:hypothetical protein
MAKKNVKQHYVPQFYLREFKTNGDNAIGCYIKHRKRFVENVRIDKECFKDYFYGDDLLIEKAFSKIESDQKNLIQEIVRELALPEKGTIKYWQLLILVTSFYLRHPKVINAKLFLAEHACGHKLSNIEAVHLSLLAIQNVVDSIYGLEILLLHNRTNTPFITSDYPIVRFSQYLQAKKVDISDLGFNSEGIQVFIPLSPNICLVLYDKSTYDIMDKIDSYVDIHSETEIFNMNLMQLLNCSDKVYFNTGISKEYTDQLEQEYQNILLLDSISNEFVSTDYRLIIPEAEQLINRNMNHLVLDLSFFKVRSSI